MSDLLKQAIADAKAVRATALSNAKAALEEHFAPKLQSMLSEKLAQELEVEDPAATGEQLPAATDVVPTEPVPTEPVPTEPVATEKPLPVEEEELNLEEIGDEEEGEMDEVRGTEFVTSAPDGAVNSEIHADTFVNEGEKASSNYKTKTKGHKTDNKGQEVKDATKLATPGTGGKSVSTKRTASDNYDGAGSQQKGGPVKDMHNKAPKTDNKGQEVEDATTLDTPGGALKESDDNIDEATLDEILNELECEMNEVGTEEAAAPMEGAACADDMDEVVNLDELLSETDDKDADDEGKKGKEGEEDDKPAFLKENISLKKELAEYRSAVEYLRNQINEVNLLNAKLLYTNKLFKQNSLSNEQKLKVIESFDLTKSVREAKLVYATLAESLNNSAKKSVEAPKKEVSQTVKTITEGLASKPVASTKPTKAAVITEGAELANRFKKLAGIRS